MSGVGSKQQRACHCGVYSNVATLFYSMYVCGECAQLLYSSHNVVFQY